MRPKKELIRVVRTPEGEVLVDATGKKSGRGVYICPSLQCLEIAVQGKRLNQALEVEIADQVIDHLREAVAMLTTDGR